MRPLRAIRTAPLWANFLLAGAFVCALYLFVPPFAGTGPVMNLLGLAPVVAVVVGVRRYKPRARAAWWCLGLGQMLFWLGDLYTYSYPKLLDKEVPFPSAGDALYVGVYPVLMAGLFLISRRRNRGTDRAGVIDSMIVTLGLGLVFWVTLIAPNLHIESMTVLAKLVSAAYPLGDVLLLAAALRLALDTGRRQGAFYLLAAGIVALLATDYAYGLLLLEGAYDGQLWLDAGWIAYYLLWGAAALHPSMRDLDERSARRDVTLTPARLALLTVASLIGPVLEWIRDIEATSDWYVCNAGSILLFGLVVVRMVGLVRLQERSAARERALSAGGVALVAATRPEEIHDAALDAARALVGGDVHAILGVVEDDRLKIVGTRGAERRAHVLPDEVAVELLRHAYDAGRPVVALSRAARKELGLEPGPSTVIGLKVRGELGGVLVVDAARGDEQTLQALATQTSLALERAALTDEVHQRTSEARFSSLVQHASDLIAVVDPAGTVVYQSPSVTRALGYTPEEILGGRLELVLERSDRVRVLSALEECTTLPEGETRAIECTLRHRDGSMRQYEVLYTNLLENEHVAGIVLNGRDVSERRAFEEQLAHQAFHDPVTGLANRALFVERVQHALARTRRDAGDLAVLFLDLDDFKAVNDSLGHAAGDQVLVEVAERVSANVRQSDTPARFGGDEFAILLEDLDDADDALATAERILASLLQPLGLEHKELAIRSSIGIAIADGTAQDAEELIRNADAAMYVAKREGKGSFCVFEPAMHAGVLERLELRADLQRAITGGQLELHFQPVVRLADGTMSGVEALLRWRHPERGLIPPDAFIPLAEEMGLIVPIGRWVLREGCRQATIFQAARPEDPLSVAVNLSVNQLQQSDVVGDVRDALAQSGLHPCSLILEITESVMMTDTDLAVARLHELKALGVRLAMDDFGTGYSSLSHLSQMPVDILKMDRSFMRGGESLQQSALATAVLALGETLKLQVVAEGIEHDEQWQTMHELGCQFGQGYLFGRPMSSDDVLELLRDDATPPLHGTLTRAA